MDRYDMNTPRVTGTFVRIHLVITWRKDLTTGQTPLVYSSKFGRHTTYFMLHQFVSERFQVPIEYLKVQRNGWMEIELLDDWIPQGRTLTLYYSMDGTKGGPPERYRYFLVR